MIDIQLQEKGERGRYEVRVPGHTDAAELTFLRPDAGTLIADHTWVPHSLRGQGIAMALVDRLMEDAKSKGFKVVPNCSYVRAAAARHPEWDELIKN